jgi:hypothetical protein
VRGTDTRATTTTTATTTTLTTTNNNNNNDNNNTNNKRYRDLLKASTVPAHQADGRAAVFYDAAVKTFAEAETSYVLLLMMMLLLLFLLKSVWVFYGHSVDVASCTLLASEEP